MIHIASLEEIRKTREQEEGQTSNQVDGDGQKNQSENTKKLLKWLPKVAYILLIIVISIVLLTLISRGASLLQRFISRVTTDEEEEVPEEIVELPEAREEGEIFFTNKV